MKKTKHKG